MADPHRTTSPHTPDAISQLERDTRVETLLLGGLDHYFAGEYERAIGVWTRVLFLDRGHARARAYIERARSAIAERQRESEELLHRGVAAFERGEAEVARRLLGAAVDRGGPHEIALAYLDRLDRLEAGTASADVAAEPRRVSRARRRAPQPGPAGARRSWVLPALILGLVTWGAVYVVISWDRIEPLFFLRQPWTGAAPSAAPAAVADALPVPSSAEIALWRARSMYSAGRLREALQILTTIEPADPLRGQADRLCSDIQRALLTGAGPTATLGLAPAPSTPAENPRPVERNE